MDQCPKTVAAHASHAAILSRKYIRQIRDYIQRSVYLSPLLLLITYPLTRLLDILSDYYVDLFQRPSIEKVAKGCVAQL